MIARWNKEEDERKKKAEEEEENKFDYASYLMDQKKPNVRKAGKPPKNKTGLGPSRSNKIGDIGNRKA